MIYSLLAIVTLNLCSLVLTFIFLFATSTKNFFKESKKNIFRKIKTLFRNPGEKFKEKGIYKEDMIVLDSGSENRRSSTQTTPLNPVPGRINLELSPIAVGHKKLSTFFKQTKIIIKS